MNIHKLPSRLSDAGRLAAYEPWGSDMAPGMKKNTSSLACGEPSVYPKNE